MSHNKLDYVNGVSVLLPEIEDILTGNRLSRKDRAVLTSVAYILNSIPKIRADVDRNKQDLEKVQSELVKNDWWGYIKSRPTLTKVGGLCLYLLLISDVRMALYKFLSELFIFLEIVINKI